MATTTTIIEPGYELHEILKDGPTVDPRPQAGYPRSSEADDYEPRESDSTPIATPVQRSNSSLHKFSVVLQLGMINFMASFASGAITVGLPTIAKALSMPTALYTWPSSVYGLASGATILLAGAIANVVGARPVELLGAFVLSAFTLACGLSQTPIQLIVFRALQGTGMSMHLPTSVALVAESVPEGKARNLSFACLGLSMPLGFSAGLVIGGILTEEAGWRSAFYLAGAACFLATGVGIWILPKPAASDSQTSLRSRLPRLWTEVDWVGCILASAGLALLTYVLSVVSADLHRIHDPVNGVLLAVSVIALIAFPLWMRHRERSGKAPLIPNSIWRNKAFTCICALVALAWGTSNSIELFSSLYFQNVQHTSTLFAGLRLLPNLIVGAIINLTVGLFVDKAPIQLIIVVASILCAGSPLMMALVNPNQPFWYMELWAQILGPFSADIMFTVGLLVISREFPEDKQNLAGAVFNTVAQFGWSLGVGLCQVVAFAVSDSEGGHAQAGGPTSAKALLDGYRASFWTVFAFLITSSILAIGGLRKIGKVGVKRD